VRDLFTTLLELLGLAAVVAGVALWSVPAALVTGGLAAVGVGYLVGRPAPAALAPPEAGDVR
jgi:hypothetical protein